MNLISDKRASSIERYTWLCNPALAEWLIEILQPLGKSILDVGCGNGYMFDFYRHNFSQIAAIEPSSPFLPVLQKRIDECNVQFESASAEKIPFDDNSFEIVFAKSSLHHFEDMLRGLAEMNRVSTSIVAILEVVAPSNNCIPFLKDILIKKEASRVESSIFTSQSLKETIESAIPNCNCRQLYFDQYIDIEAWLEYGDLTYVEKNKLFSQIISMEEGVAKDMQFHIQGNRYVMLRRMCLCVCDIKKDEG